MNPAALKLVPQHHHCPDCANKDRVIAELSERLNEAGEEEVEEVRCARYVSPANRPRVALTTGATATGNEVLMQDVPYGYCQCGCGRKTWVPTFTNRSQGYEAGVPRLYARGHANLIPLHERYREEDRGHATPCWIWQGNKDVHGYGAVRFENKPIKAHRWVYEKLRGPIAEGLVIDHLCRVTLCVNPDHLEPVKQAENARRGSQAKITREIAEEIRQSPLGCRRLARQYELSTTQIRHIKRGIAWSSEEAA